MANRLMCLGLMLLIAVLCVSAEEQCSAGGAEGGSSCAASTESGGEAKADEKEEAPKKRKTPTRKEQMEALVMENMDLRRALWDTRDQMSEYQEVVEKWAEGAIGDIAKEALERSKKKAADLAKAKEEGKELTPEEEDYQDVFTRQLESNSKLASLNLLHKLNGEELKFKDFYDNFAAEAPVLLRGMDLPMKDWTLDFLTEMCGSKRADSIVKHNSSFAGWGGLEPQDASSAPTLREFLSAFDGEPSKLDVEDLYLHDWPLTSNCPELLEHPEKGFAVPKFFSQDYLKRIAVAAKEMNLPYANDFPGLFVGQAGTQTGMHVDSFGSNFWMYLIGGLKEWHFYLPQDRVFLGEDRARRTFAVDSFNPNFTAQPLFYYARGWRVVQKPGDIVYVPEGIPHQVRNVEDSVAVSVNFIDGSNYKQAVERLYRDGDPGSNELFRLLTDKSFDGSMTMDARQLNWREYNAHRVKLTDDSEAKAEED